MATHSIMQSCFFDNVNGTSEFDIQGVVTPDGSTCIFYIVLILVCIIQAVVAFMLLLIELSKKGRASFFRVRSQIFTVILVLQLNTALHFMFYSGQLKLYSIIMIDSVRFYVFYLVLYYFTKKATNLLTLTDGRIP